MRPWLGLLLLAGLALGAHALPPIITVKHLRARSGASYKWTVSSSVAEPFAGPVYPNQTGTAKVSVLVERTPAPKNYVVSGKLIVSNPANNDLQLTIASLKANLGPAGLLSLPHSLDCPQQQVLEPGQALLCSFRLEASSSNVKTFTPLVNLKGLPQLQGEPLLLQWPEEEQEAEQQQQQQQSGAGRSSAEDGCALVQVEMDAGEVEPLVRLSTGKDSAGLLREGLEVCGEKANFTYTVSVGPFKESSGLCGAYTMKDASLVRLAAASIGTSSASRTSLPVTFSGCRQKGLLGGHKPVVAISNLTLSRATTQQWGLSTWSSINTSIPATVKFDGQQPVEVSVKLQRTAGQQELLMSGQVTVTNTELIPYILPAEGVRVVLTSPKSSEKQYITATCPMAGSNIVIDPKVDDDTPGSIVCQFSVPIEESWRKGTLQAQLQTLLSATHEVDSGVPQPYDFSDEKQVQETLLGECVSLQLLRVTDQVFMRSANADPAIMALARSLGGDRFRLLPSSQGIHAAAGNKKVPPQASDSSAEPLVVCSNETIAWRETYGPFPQTSCGPNMALMGLTAIPTTGAGDAVTSTLSYPIAVKGCMLKPEIKAVELRASNQEVFDWKVQQSRSPEGNVKTLPQQPVPVQYEVRYSRTSSMAGFKVSGVFEVSNPHAADITLQKIGFAITRPEGAPVTGEATCDAKMEEQQDTVVNSPKDAANSSSSDSSSDNKPRRIIKLAAVDAAAAGADAPAEPATGNGPTITCRFEAELPDNHAGSVHVFALTDEGSNAEAELGTLDWSKATTTAVNMCALASFSFSADSSALTQPSFIDGTAPPALAVKICEPRQYSFTATFNAPAPKAGAAADCGTKEAVSVATLSFPDSVTVQNAQQSLLLETIGCVEPLPVLSVQAVQQQPVQGSYTWSLVSKLSPMGAAQRSLQPVVTVATPTSPHPGRGVLVLPARAGQGGYSRFNRTITVKRSKLDSKENLFEVKGEVKLVNKADRPLHLKHIEVHLTCEAESCAPTKVRAVCPEAWLDSDFSAAAGKEQTYITVPATASAESPVKCQFGALVHGPAAVTVRATALTLDGRTTSSKNTAQVELRSNGLSTPSTLGSCIRVQEAQQVYDSRTNAEASMQLTQGSIVPEGGVEVCDTRSWWFVGRLGPFASQGCQSVTFQSSVEAVPSSGYQSRLTLEGSVDVSTPSCT